METAVPRKIITRRNILIITVILVLAALIAGLNIYRSRAQAGVPVMTAGVEKKPLGESVFTTGRVQLADKQELYAYSSKVVKDILVKPGDKVKKGQVMGCLEAVEEENRLKEARANLALQQAEYDKVVHPLPRDIEVQRAASNSSRVALENARKKLERTEYLYHEGAVSARELETVQEEFTAAEAEYIKAKAGLDKLVNGPAGAELDALQAKLEQARAGVEIARENLAKCMLTADRDGTVLTVEAEKGDYVAAGTRLITVGDPARLEVVAGVGEADSGRLEPGQPVKITAAALPEVEFTGTVTEVAGAAIVKNSNNGQQIEVPVKVAVDPGAQGLRPGYTVDLKIITVPERTTLVVPYEAILDKDGGKQVFVVRENRAVLRHIKTGLAGDLYIEVLEGLHEGDKIILSPGENITDGVQVKDMANPGGKAKGERP
jgi:HlyD family secretion protein